MARLPVAGENAAIAAVLVPGTTYYLSLHSADPGTTGASELTGGGYVRQAYVPTAAAAGAESNTASITVPNAGTVPATHIGIWTTATVGTYLIGAALGSTVTAASIQFAAGAASFSAS